MLENGSQSRLSLRESCVAFAERKTTFESGSNGGDANCHGHRKPFDLVVDCAAL